MPSNDEELERNHEEQASNRSQKDELDCPNRNGKNGLDITVGKNLKNSPSMVDSSSETANKTRNIDQHLPEVYESPVSPLHFDNLVVSPSKYV